jgi:hypothetical protein
MPSILTAMRCAAILTLVCAAAAGLSCAHAPPAQRIREPLQLPPPPEDAPLFAGIDLLDHVPFALRNRPPHDDAFRFDPDGGAVVRTVCWRDSGFEILFVCAVGQRDAASAAAQLPTVLAGLGFDARELALVAGGPGHAAVGHARHRDRLVAWTQGNVCVAIRQSGEARYDLRDLARAIDAAIREQPPLTDGAFPHLREVVSPGSLDKLKIGAHVQFTLKPEGERGFLPAGWKIRELGRSFSTWLHVDRMTLAIQATRAGSFSITLWVSNKRQLATLASARFKVVE